MKGCSKKALVTRRGRLLKAIARYQRTVREIESELRSRGIPLSKYAPAPNRYLPLFRHGEMMRCCLVVLKGASAPMSMREIVAALIVGKGGDPNDPNYRNAVRQGYHCFDDPEPLWDYSACGGAVLEACQVGFWIRATRNCRPSRVNTFSYLVERATLGFPEGSTIPMSWSIVLTGIDRLLAKPHLYVVCEAVRCHKIVGIGHHR